jgi:hypothetical protein
VTSCDAIAVIDVKAADQFSDEKENKIPVFNRGVFEDDLKDIVNLSPSQSSLADVNILLTDAKLE